MDTKSAHNSVLVSWHVQEIPFVPIRLARPRVLHGPKHVLIYVTVGAKRTIKYYDHEQPRSVPLVPMPFEGGGLRHALRLRSSGNLKDMNASRCSLHSTHTQSAVPRNNSRNHQHNMYRYRIHGIRRGYPVSQIWYEHQVPGMSPLCHGEYRVSNTGYMVRVISTRYRTHGTDMLRIRGV